MNGGDDKIAQDDLEMFNAPQEIIEALSKEPEKFLVWPENKEAVEMFVRLTTQWNVGAMGVIMGLKYESLDFLVKLYCSDKPHSFIQTLFEDIQVMEFSAINELNKEKKKK